MVFPVNGILDNFNRPDEGPPPAGWTTWTNEARSLKISSNTLIESDPVNGGGAVYWNRTKFAPNSEAFVKITTIGLGTRVHTRVDPVAIASYFVKIAPPSTVTLRRLTSAGSTTLATFTQTVISGDSLGISAIGPILTAWYKSGSLAWTSLGTYNTSSDATKYNNSGFIGVELDNVNDPTSVLDDFGGGSLQEFRKTLSGIGTKTGSRQVHGW